VFSTRFRGIRVEAEGLGFGVESFCVLSRV
jgi:hypothetical protein